VSGNTPFSDGTWRDPSNNVWNPGTQKWTNPEGLEWDPATQQFGPPSSRRASSLQDFQSRLEALKASSDWDTLNLGRARQELDRWLQAQQIAASDASRIQSAREQIGKYGTALGKTSFSANELGAPFAQFARFSGLDPNAPFAQYTGTQTWNPVGDRLRSLDGMGVGNAPPPVPGLVTDAPGIPFPPPADGQGAPVRSTRLPSPGVLQRHAASVANYNPAVGGPDPMPFYARGTLSDHPSVVQAAMARLPRFAAGTPDPTAVSESVTGTQIPLDQAQIEQILAGIILQARNQDAALAAQQLQAQNDRVAARQKSLEMLAARSGPQDWVAYNYLLNGMAAPTGQRVDPTAWANEIRDPRLAPYAEYANGGASAGRDPANALPQAAAAAVPRTGSAQEREWQDSLGHIWRNGRWEDTAGHYTTNAGASWLNPDGTPYQSAARTSATADPSASGASSASGRLKDGTPGLSGAAFAGGGYTHAPEFIVGDRPEGLGDVAELIVNPTHAPIRVLSHPQLMALFRAAKEQASPRFAAGTGAAFPDQGGSTVLAADGSYGMPQTPSYRSYAPAVIGNQPFYQKLVGASPSAEFAAFGAPLSNAALGIREAPANINLQNYAVLNPTEQQQVQSLYNQGLGVDFADIYARAKAAYAPMLNGGPQRWTSPSYGI
jgi:hypothetical protein